MKRIIISLVTIITISFNINGQTQAIYSRSSISCIGVELDGSQTLRVHGYGRNRADAKERYEDYFNIFFADGGEYKKYVSLKDTKKRSADRVKNKVGYSYEMTIRVLRSELKNRLKSDNVISKDHL